MNLPFLILAIFLFVIASVVLKSSLANIIISAACVMAALYLITGDPVYVILAVSKFTLYGVYKIGKKPLKRLVSR